MARISQTKHGKIEAHGSPLGVTSRADIERRAEELALIDGRSDFNASDIAQAQRELNNDDLPATLVEDVNSSMQSMSRDPSDPITDRGHQTPEYTEIDEKEALERSALEGVEEAQHDQMVQARNATDDELDGR